MMSNSKANTGRNKAPEKSSSKNNGKPTLNDILGRAKSTLNQSRQFRDARSVSGKPVTRSTEASKNGAASVSQLLGPVKYENRKLDAGLGSSFQLRKSGPVPVAREGLERRKQTDYESSNSDSTLRSAVSLSSAQRRHSSPGGSRTSSANDSDSSDSTITPPTITDDPQSSKSKRHLRVRIEEDVIPLPHEVRNAPVVNMPYSKSEGKNLLQRTLLVRGDPVSNESYAVLKAMMFEKEYSNYEGINQSYTEDFVSEIVSTAKSDSIEVPVTESSTAEREISFDESVASVTMKDTRSSLIVAEIVENLQDLEVSDQVQSYNEENQIPGIEEQMDLSDLEAILNSQLDDEELVGILDTDENQDTKSNAPSRSIKGSSNVSIRMSRSKTNGSIKSIRTKTSSNTASKASIPISDRISSRKSFQQILLKVKLNEKDEDLASPKDEYESPVTKPQRQIQQILEKEVYQKEFKRIRSIHKKEEIKQTKIQEIKSQNLAEARKVKESGIRYKEPSYTKLLLPELIQNPLAGAVSKNSSSNLGAPYFNLDGSLGMDYSIGNYPRTPDENFNQQVEKMDIPQLVREVLASNERMYKATVDASKQMGKEYGKNAKLLLKMKNKELHGTKK